jgi:hypothetical protein
MFTTKFSPTDIDKKSTISTTNLHDMVTALRTEINKIDTFGKQCISAFNDKCINPGQETMKVNLNEFHDYLASSRASIESIQKIFSNLDLKTMLEHQREIIFEFVKFANYTDNTYRILHSKIIMSFEYKIAYFHFFEAMSALKEKIGEVKKTVNKICKNKIELVTEVIASEGLTI